MYIVYILLVFYDISHFIVFYIFMLLKSLTRVNVSGTTTFDIVLAHVNTWLSVLFRRKLQMPLC